MLKFIVLAVILLSGAAIAAESEPSARGGIPVDRFGGPAVDPTENVKALSEAASKRQDDLRAAFEKQIATQLEGMEDLNKLRADNNKELREAEVRRIDSDAKLRAEFSERLAVAEAKRIDAIRAVDVNAVAVASTRATDQATVLAAQVSQSAEALRSLVATTAATVAAAQQQLSTTLSARLTTLEQAGYQQAGSAKFQDPQFLSLIAKVEAIAAVQRDTAGIGAGRNDVVGWVVAGITLTIALIGSAVAVFSVSRATKSAPVQPIMPVETVYAPPRRRAKAEE